MKAKRHLLLFVFLLSCVFVAAQDPVVIPHLSGTIKFDGMPDEPAWKEAVSLPATMQSPYSGKEPSEKTEFLVAWDNAYVYFGARFYDKDPAGIRMPSMKRDETAQTNDFFGIGLDTYNDKENGVYFATTPSGLRTDFTVFNDAQPKGMSIPFNFDWNTFWDVKTVINDEGWFAEIRIPVSSLRFQEVNGRVIMGLSLTRRIARKNEWDSYPLISQNWGWMGLFKPSQTHEIVFQDLKRRKPFYIAPYVLGGFQQEHQLNETGEAYLIKNSPQFHAGGDIKYGITSNLAMDITVYPDFAQVEADDQMINLTRFSLFYPEKRPFFQERSSNFNFNFGDFNRLFYSRRIGLEQGEQVPIYAGVRLVGRTGPWDIGVLDMQTAAVGHLDLPSENFGIVRIKRQVINKNTYVGGIVTTRLGMNGTYNVAYGLDGVFNLFGNDFLNVMWAQTFEDDKDNKPLSLNPARIKIGWERRMEKGLGYNLNYSRAGVDYSPGIGFEMRQNFSQYQGRIWWGWIPGEKSKLLNHKIFLGGDLITRNTDGSAETAILSPGWSFRSKGSSEGNLQINFNHESVTDTFYLAPDTYIPNGDYNFLNAWLMYNTPNTHALMAKNMLTIGKFYDGVLMSASISPQWNISPRLTLSGTYIYTAGNFADRDQHFHSHIARFKVLIMPSTKIAIASFVQYNSAIRAVITNFRFRYNPKEGNDLYIVYNEDFNTARGTETPVLPVSNTRAVLLKYTYTFIIEK